MKNRNKKVLILVGLFSLLVFMGVGFALVGTTLNIGGTSTAINTWDVRISNITPKENDTGAKSVSSEIEPTQSITATFAATFHAPGDYIEYDVEVKNRGSLDATLYSLVVTPSGDDVDLFDFAHTAEQGSVLKAGETTTFTIKVSYRIDSTRLPNGETKFELSINYGQGENAPGGGSIPGGGESGSEEEDWLFEVDESGTITAYNYNSTLTETPQDVVVPAEVNGVPVTTITEQSFIPQGNVDLYMDESVGQIYFLIHESTTEAYETVKEKGINLFITGNCGTDTDCTAQYKAMMNFCSDKDTCYNLAAEEAGTAEKVSISATAELMQNVYVNPDPDVALEDSVLELEPNVTTLDLSNATNLTTIESNALSGAGLESVEFGDNSNITSIGNSAFSNNELTSVEIPASVETIGSCAFCDNQIETVTFGETTEVQNQLTKNKKYSLSKMETTLEKIATSNSNLKSIGNSAFSNNKIQSIVLPDTLETIEGYAFQNNQISGELLIPSNIITIRDSAFYSNNISTLYFPKTVTTLGYNAFSNNPIQTLTVEECNTTICSGYGSGNQYFGNQIINLTIESGEIGNNAFSSSSSSTTKIESLTLGEGVTSMGNYAFQNNLLQSVTLPSQLVTVGDYAFYNNQILELNIPESLTTIGQSAFSGNSISTLTIPKTVTTIGNSAFYNNPIETLTIAKCTTDICSYHSFGNQVKNLTIESGEIGTNAFSTSPDSTTKVENLTLGEGVTSIGGAAFTYNSITELVLPSTLTSIDTNAFMHGNINTLTLPAGLTTMHSAAFDENPIETLTIGKCTSDICSVNKFGTQVKTLTVESGEIGGYAFSSEKDSTTKLESLTLGSNVTSIGRQAFENNNISTLIIPDSVTSVGTDAFRGNVFENLTIKKCTTSICVGRVDTTTAVDAYSGSNSFGNEISNLVIESGEIGYQAFYHKWAGTTIQTLSLGEGVTQIGAYAFYSHTINSELTIPASVTTIGDYAFYSNQISSLSFAENSSLTTIGSSVFGANQISGSLAIPEGVTTIGAQSFYGNQIISLTIPSTVTYIRSSAFEANPTLATLIINRPSAEDFLANVTIESTVWYDQTLISDDDIQYVG